MERSDSDHFPCSVRNVKSALNQFPATTQACRTVDRTEKPVEEMIAEERESSSAQIRNLFNEQRKTIIAEYCEKVSHHELLAAQAEQERKILQEELWRQQQDILEVHQQNLTEMEELQKIQNSTFDEFAQKKFIEDQNTIMELSGRLQNLQNEVNCMNESKDFQDAESVRSGNSHVTSQPMSFPAHPIPEGMLRPSFKSQRHTDGPPNIWDTSGKSLSSLSERTGRPVVERTGRPFMASGQELNTEHAQIRTLLDRQKEQILANCQAEIKKHDSQADYDRRSVPGD